MRTDRRASSLEWRMRQRFQRLMKEKKSKMGSDKNHRPSISQVYRYNKIEDNWLDWILIWKAAAASATAVAEEKQVEIDQGAVVLLKQAFERRSEVVYWKRKGFYLSPKEAVVKIQISFRAYLRKKSQIVQALRELATANAKLKKMRGLLKDSEEPQKFSDKIIVLILTVDAIDGANAKLRVAKKLMVGELNKMLNKVDNNNTGSQSQQPSTYATSIRMEDHSDAARKIQRSFRAYLVRNSRALQADCKLELLEIELGEIRFLFNDFSYRRRVSRDSEERQTFAEKIIVFLLTVDAIEGVNVMIRGSKKSMVDELEAMLEIIDNISNSGKNCAASMELVIEERDEDTTDHRSVLLRWTFTKRVGKEKAKWNELSPADAAIKIQRSFRAYLVRRKQALRAYQELAVAGTKLREVKGLFNSICYRRRVAQDAEERQRFTEKIIVLLLTVDAIEGVNVMIRGSKKSMVDELEAMLDIIDNRSMSEKNCAASMELMIEERNEDTTDHRSVLLRWAFTKRVGMEKAKWNELSPADAAIKIQRSFRDYLVSKKQALRTYQELAVAGTKLREVKGLFNNICYRRRVAQDAEERQRFAEKIIVLLLTVDAIEGVNVMIRGSKKFMVDELEAMLDIIDNRSKSQKNCVASIELVIEERDEDTTDHSSVLLRWAFTKRVGEEKAKWNELSPADAAIKIQRSFRAYLVRRKHALRAYQELAVAGTKLREVKGLFNNICYRRRVAQDAEERQRFAEKIIVLLLTVDAIEGVNVMIRGSKKYMVDELEAMLDVIDNRSKRKKLCGVNGISD